MIIYRLIKTEMATLVCFRFSLHKKQDAVLVKTRFLPSIARLWNYNTLHPSENSCVNNSNKLYYS